VTAEKFSGEICQGRKCLFLGEFSGGEFKRGNVRGKISGVDREICPEVCPGKGGGINVRIPMQDYKSLRVAAMIRDILVNTQTHRRRQLLTEYAINSAS